MNCPDVCYDLFGSGSTWCFLATCGSLSAGYGCCCCQATMEKGGVALEYENHKPCLPGWAWPKKSGALSRVIYESLVSMIHG